MAPTVAEGDSAEVILHGQFNIHGATHEASIPATVVTHPDGIRVRGETPLNLKDYKIGGLSKLMGMLKMYDKITVHIDLTFRLHRGGQRGKPRREPFNHPRRP